MSLVGNQADPEKNNLEGEKSKLTNYSLVIF